MKEYDTKICSLDLSIKDQMRRINACVDACFGISDKELKLARYAECKDKSEKYDDLIPNVYLLFEVLDILLEATKSIDKSNYKVMDARKKAMKILSELRD